MVDSVDSVVIVCCGYVTVWFPGSSSGACQDLKITLPQGQLEQ